MFTAAFDFLERVKITEFGVAVFFSSLEQGYVIMLWRHFPEEEKPNQKELEKLQSLADELLATIPRNKQAVKQGISTNIGAIRGKFSFEVSLAAADPQFVKQLINIEDRSFALNEQFDAKVTEEMQADPTVAALELAKAKASEDLESISSELDARKEAIRKEKERLRKPFIYLADERAL